jgi:hypothetical protein
VPRALGTRALDDVPAVAPREHQVEDAHVRLLEAEPRQALVALSDDDGIESGGGQMPGHSVGDHRIVLDDQDLGHTRV